MSAQPLFAAWSTAAKSAAAILIATVSATSASAQIIDRVDRSLLENWRLTTGSTLRFCQFENAPTAEFDRAVGQAIADSLLLNAEFVVLGDAYGIGGEYAAEDLFVSLTNDCEFMLGMGLAPGLYPTEFITTRAYVGMPYVLGVADENIEELIDIPGDRSVGALVGSYGLSATVRYAATLPEEQRWLILPYGDTQLMTTRVLDGSIGGMVVYGPSFLEYERENELDGEILLRELRAEMAATIDIGALAIARNTYLRTIVDEAITQMVQDGTIETLLAEHGLDSLPVAIGGRS